MIESPPRIPAAPKARTISFYNTCGPLILRINNSYEYWSKVKYLPRPQGITAEELWTLVKLNRRMNYICLDLGPDTFHYYITGTMQRVLHLLDQNAGGYLSSHIQPSASGRQAYLTRSIMEEAIASSQMEGASTTRRVAKEMLLRGLSPRTRSERMIHNNYRTIRELAIIKEEPMTPELLLRIHSLITHDTLDRPEEEGHFRTSDDITVCNQITGETVHTPPPHDRVPELIDHLCRFCNEDYTRSPIFIHPIVQGIIIHFLLAYIHPFADGNGRTARALFYWYLLRQGYWLTEYLSISRIIYRAKTRYEQAFLYTELDENDLSYFIQYNLEVMERSYTALQNYIRRKLDQRIAASHLLAIPGINERQAVLLKKLSDDPDMILTVKEVENRFGISNFTARSDLRGLVGLGLMTEIQANKMKINYIRSSDFDLRLSALQAGKSTEKS